MRSSKRTSPVFGGSFWHSVNAALEGVVHTFRSERNMRVHFLAAIAVLVAGVYFNLDHFELMILCLTVTAVLVAEMINTSIEHAVDLINDEYHPLAKISKDVAAGAVFVTAVNACIVGYILFFKRFKERPEGAFFLVKQSPWHITFIAVLVSIGVVVLVKALRGEKSLLRGGMPSGHSAFAFSVWVIISMLTRNALISILAFFLALLVARSRISKDIHSLFEVFMGSLLGALVALMVFQLLY